MCNEPVAIVTEEMRGRRVQVKEGPFNTYAQADERFPLTCRTGKIYCTISGIYYNVEHDDGRYFPWKPEELIYLVI